MAFRLRRGTEAELFTITPEEGELIYTTDTKTLYVGDGVTVGGISTAAGYTGSAGVGYTGSAAGDGTSLFNGSYTATLDADGMLTVPGSIIPDTDVAYDLGSDTNRFKDIYLSGSTINLGGSTISIDEMGQLLITNGDVVNTLGSSLTNGDFTAILDADGMLTVPGSIIPDTDVAYDLGSDTNRFKDIYLSGSTIYLGGSTISINEMGQLQFGGNNLNVDSLVNGDTSIVLNSDGTLTFPADSLSLQSGIDFSISTAGPVQIFATVTNPGTGYPESGDSATTGGSGEGLTVAYTTGEGGAVNSVDITNPGSGYQNGDELTLTAGGGNATITLTIAATIYNWMFGSDGDLKIPGKISFPSRSINQFYTAEALTFKKSSAYKAVSTTGGTMATPGVEALFIAGGDAYADPITGARTAPGGNITVLGGQGSPAGTVTISGGRGTVPGDVNIIGGYAVSTTTGSGGTVRVLGGGGNSSAVGGDVVVVGGPGNGGDGGSVVISGGAGTNSGAGTNGGDIVIQGGTAQTPGGLGGKISLKTNSSPQGGSEYQWDFTVDGKTKFPTNAAPVNNYGVAGDVTGMVAFDNTYVYYCTANYVDTSTPIWKRIALTTW